MYGEILLIKKVSPYITPQTITEKINNETNLFIIIKFKWLIIKLLYFRISTNGSNPKL